MGVGRVWEVAQKLVRDRLAEMIIKARPGK